MDFSEVTPHLSCTISKLEELKEKKNGPRLSKFLSVCPSEPVSDASGLFTFEFNGHTIRDGAKQRSEAFHVCDLFVEGMIKNLNSRFSNNADSLVLSSLSNLFNPLISHSLKSDDVEHVSDYLDSVGFQGYREELLDFVVYVGHMVDIGSKVVSNSRDVANLAIRKKEVYPAVAEAAERFLVAPVSTVDCERGFSKQNLIKTCLRNSLSVDSLDSLMRISIDGPSQSSFDFPRCFRKWSSVKARRILY